MPLLPLDSNLTGKILMRTIYGSSGQVLLKRGVELSSKYIQLLRSKGFTHVYAGDAWSSDIDITDAISEDTRTRATILLQTIASNLQDTETLSAQDVQEVVDSMINDINANVSLVMCLASLRQKDDYTFVHSVNVSVLSLIIAKRLCFSPKQMKVLGIGTLLHDIGKTAIPTSILNKPSRLRPDEFSQVKKHTWEGFKILINRFEVSAVAAHISLDHHERLNGSGYPRQLRGKQIDTFTRIAAVSDVFDAMTTDRVYRPRVHTDRAQDVLVDSARDGFLDPEVVDVLINSTPRYPNGTLVILSTGELGIVAKQHASESRHPTIKILSDAELYPVRPYFVDLAQSEHIEVRQVIDDYPETFKERMRNAQVSI